MEKENIFSALGLNIGIAGEGIGGSGGIGGGGKAAAMGSLQEQKATTGGGSLVIDGSESVEESGSSSTDSSRSSSASSTPTNNGGNTGGQGSASSAPLEMTLDAAMFEVEARFLLNLPEEELASVERLFFQLEQAHWYYEDFLADQHENLPHFPLEGFTQALFTRSELLQHLQERHADLVRDFHTYKYAVPVYGCVLLSPGMDKILLVCNWEGTVWGLPRGKINEGEEGIDCAARETYEECGYDASGRLKEADSFTMVQNAKRIKMYIVRDVPEDFPFKPQVRKEVSEIRFFPFDALPTKSYNVQHSIAHVRHWMEKLSKAKNKGGSNKRQSKETKSRGNSQPAIVNGGGRQKGGGGGHQHQQQKELRHGCSSITNSSNHRSNSSDRNGSAGKGGRTRSAPDVRPPMDPSDVNNVATFGLATAGAWGVDAMFQANEKLTGRKFTYDGNPQKFGEYHVAVHTAKGGKGHVGRGGTSTGERQAGGQQPRGATATTTCARVEEIEAGQQEEQGGKRRLMKKTITTTTTSPPSVSNGASLAPSVASLLTLAASSSSITSSKSSTAAATTNGVGSNGYKSTTASSSSSSTVYSCARLEAQAAATNNTASTLGVGGQGEEMEREVDPLSGFTFDTQDILSALSF